MHIGQYTLKLELCKAHTPLAHCVVYRFISLHGYNFVNLREKWKLCCLVVPMTLETALFAPRQGRHELVPIFCCNNSIIAILHTDWFHGASLFSPSSQLLTRIRDFRIIYMHMIVKSWHNNTMYLNDIGSG